MVEQEKPRQDLMHGLYTRLRAARLSRRVRLRHTLRAVRKREQAHRRELPRQPVAAPRLWQRYLIVPLLTVVREIRNGLAWVRTSILPAPAPILDVDPAQFLIVGHRGASASVVENTIESCEYAVEVEGANAVEIDVCVTKDGQVVVWHDWDPDALVAFARQAEAELFSLCRPVVPSAGHPMRRPVCDLTLDELREHYGYAVVGTAQIVHARIPVLEDVVRWARTKPQLKAVLLDCKVPPARKELITVVAAALRREVEREPVGAQFVFLTPHAEVFEVTKAVVPAAMRSFDVEIPAGFLPDRSQLSAVAWARASGNGWASIGRPLFTIGGWWIYSTTVQDDLEQIREACRTTQPLVPEYYVCWTINRTREMRYLMRLGVSGILTDFPGRLRRLLNRKRRQDDRRMARQARQQARREQRETKGQGLSSASNVR